MSTLYAIHDPWFHGMPDGDVDDRAAFCAYEQYLCTYPEKKIIVHVGDRYEEAMRHYSHFRIEFRKEMTYEEVSGAEKICICAPVKSFNDRLLLTMIMTKKQNGYCQGSKMGCMNFPNSSYSKLLESVTHRYSTIDTLITFPVSLIQKLDPIYWEDYQEYGFIKLFSPGAVQHIPGLLYRLYCPELGGGPGTNMLTIQKCLQKYGILTEIPVDKDHFIEFNKAIISKYALTPTKGILKATNIPELIESLMVMCYFGNIVYKVDGGLLYQEETELYSLQNLPKGILQFQEKYTPPLYDLVAAHAVLYDKGVPTQEDILEFYS
jgi:hypothetical protein